MELTVNDLRDLIGTHSQERCSTKPTPQIVVLDRGFVYVGLVTIENDWCVIRNASNIRAWGTSKGLGELALNGPLSNTKLDSAGTVRAPLRAVIHMIDTAAKWNLS